ncbi:HAD domain-containing protein [Cupriavidus lacunae]|uniref:Hydrolase n=1 Tax=Cupriavidus lacunae TaxID=2666307 RepID=A0A370NU65_9BURK|nr:HAD domain-containing protein [Cupriavidus lacunae]RDK09145.1 hydrolase [Cupriavidus lacunae]
MGAARGESSKGWAVEKSSRKNVLFVDYDNCLHRSDAYVVGEDVVASEPGVVLFEYAGILEQLLEPYPDVKIVLSTDWIQVFGFERARDALPIAALRERVIGATYPDDDTNALQFSTLTRGEQVLRYVAKHRLRSWLALDDRKDGFESCMLNLVHCQRSVGLGDCDVQRMLRDRLYVTFHVKDWR